MNPQLSPTVDSSKTALVVLGMHRSGTSAFARVLNMCGASLPAHILPPKPDNLTGFWEPARAAQLNDHILTEVGSAWSDFSTLPADTFSRNSQFIHDIARLLSNEYSASTLFVLKEPRICRLAPLWISALATINATPRFVIPVRNPIEVASSLHQRDGLTKSHALLLWLRYLLDAEQYTSNLPRSFVLYPSLLKDWRSCIRTISADLNFDLTPPARVEKEIDEFLKPALQHQRTSDDDLFNDPSVADWIKQTYSWVLKRSHGDTHDADQLLTIRNQVELAEQAYGRVITEKLNIASIALGEKEEEISRARENINSLAAQIEESRLSHTLRDRVEAEMRASLQERTMEICEARKNIDSLVKEIGEAREAHGALESQLDKAREAHGALESQLDKAREAHRARESELAEARSTINHFAEQIQTARRAITEKEAEIADARENINDLAEQIEQARRSHACRDEIEADLRRRLDESVKEIAQTQQKIALLMCELDEARQSIAIRAGIETALRQEVKDLSERLTAIERTWLFRIRNSLRLRRYND